MLFKLVGIPKENMEGYQSGQMGRAVNPLTSVFESSNLSPSTKLKKCFIIEGEKVWIMRVSYNGNTSDFQSDARSSILLIRSKLSKNYI